jgi:type VI secretion system protein ImpA
MPEMPPIGVNDYLLPISEADPSGESLRYEDEYAEIERAREEEADADSSDRWKKRNPKKADWDAVIALGLKALKEQTKDIEIAAWVAEALSRRRGLAGLRDGLRLIRAIQDAFWSTAHPSFGDLELREGVYEFLDDDKRLPLIIRNTPIVAVPGLPAYTVLKYKESRDVKNILLKSPERVDELKGDGKVLPDDFDQAAEATDRAFYVSTLALLGECLEATTQLNQSIRSPEHYGSKGATLTRTAAALEEVIRLAKQFLASKPAPEPEPIEETAVPEPSSSSEVEWAGTDQAPGEGGSSWESTPKPASPRPEISRQRTARQPSAGPIAGPEDARSWIAAAASHLREADPSDPVPYLVIRSLRMGEIYRNPGPIGPSMLRPPTSEDRQTLRKLANDASWAELLEQAEQALARPEATGWLDARRLALRALDELGHEDAARAARAVLGAELRDYPDWPRSELDDGTPCAGAETRAWIEETFTAGADSALNSMAPSSVMPSGYSNLEPSRTGDDEVRTPDPWEQAQELQRGGRAQEAISLLGRAAREATTGRERFLRTFQQAEICLLMGRPGVATPLLEGLARQIDEFRLDQWEDPALCARVVAALYQCVKGKDEARARAIYDRLCQLDIAQALSLGELADP